VRQEFGKVFVFFSSIPWNRFDNGDVWNIAIFSITKVYDTQRNGKEEYQNHEEDDEDTQIKEHLLQHGD
jgi:hypothetical protein